jgi:hypothetical protein
MSKFRGVIPPTLKAALKNSPFLKRGISYKFHHSRHSQSILGDGVIKIGRQSDYRLNNIKETIRDEHEGVEWTAFGTPTRISEVDPRSAVHAAIQVSPNNDQNVFFHGLSVKHEHEDLYMYCFSYECSSTVLKSFEDDEAYDAVVICDNIFNVAEVICEHHPILRGSTYLCLPMHYRDRVHMADEPYAPPVEQAFEKPIKYRNNVEGRIVFKPPTSLRGRPELALWGHPDIAKCFRAHALP